MLFVWYIYTYRRRAGWSHAPARIPNPWIFCFCYINVLVFCSAFVVGVGLRYWFPFPVRVSDFSVSILVIMFEFGSLILDFGVQEASIWGSGPQTFLLYIYSRAVLRPLGLPWAPGLGRKEPRTSQDTKRYHFWSPPGAPLEVEHRFFLLLLVFVPWFFFLRCRLFLFRLLGDQGGPNHCLYNRVIKCFTFRKDLEIHGFWGAARLPQETCCVMLVLYVL